MGGTRISARTLVTRSPPAAGHGWFFRPVQLGENNYRDSTHRMWSGQHVRTHT